MKEINIEQATAITSPDPLMLLCTTKENGSLNMAPVSFKERDSLKCYCPFELY